MSMSTAIPTARNSGVDDREDRLQEGTLILDLFDPGRRAKLSMTMSAWSGSTRLTRNASLKVSGVMSSATGGPRTA